MKNKLLAMILCIIAIGLTGCTGAYYYEDPYPTVSTSDSSVHQSHHKHPARHERYTSRPIDQDVPVVHTSGSHISQSHY